MAGGTKNLGQVAGLFIGTTPPENTSLIWYDSTPSMQCHKVYSVTLGQWVVLDDNTISAVEYSVLRNRAQDPGLSVGQWFKITDKDNALALAITSTKVQYVDSIGNILIDDLSASIQYHVTHQNLLIDDVHGVFDVVNKRLVFEFSEVSAVNFLGDDYVLAERKVNNAWSLFKIKFSKLLSTTSGNTITWDNGFYLNFTSRFTALLDVTGGAVSKTTFDNTIASIRTDLTNVASNQQAVAEQAAAAVAAAVTDDMIFDKRLPEDPDVSTGPGDIIEGDTLQMIVNKAQRWFNSLKWATGIGLSDDYAEATQNFNVNNNDSVETAIAKLAGHVRALQEGADNGTDNVIVSPGYDDAPTSDNGSGVGSPLTRLLEKLRFYSIKHEDTDGVKVASAFENEPTSGNQTITPGTTALTTLLTKFQYWINRSKTTDGPRLADSYSPQNRMISPGVALTRVLEKLAYDISQLNSTLSTLSTTVTNITTEGKLPNDWAAKAITSVIADVAGGITISEAFSRLVGRLNQLGVITNGKLVSNALNGNNQRRTELDLGSGSMTLRDNASAHNVITPSGINQQNGDSMNYFMSYAKKQSTSTTYTEDTSEGDYVYSGALFANVGVTSSGWYETVALTAKNNLNGRKDFDAYFKRLHIGELSLGLMPLSDSNTTKTISRGISVVIGYASNSNMQVTLPKNPVTGLVIYVLPCSSKNIVVKAASGDKIDNGDGTALDSYTCSGRGRIFMFIWVEGLSYGNNPSDGLWEAGFMTDI